MMESLKMVVALQLLELFVIVFAWTVQGSAGSAVQTPLALPPLTSAVVPPTMKGSVPSLPLLSPTVSPPLTSAVIPPTTVGTVPSLPLGSPTALPPLTSASLPPTTNGTIPSLPLHSPTVSPPLTSATLPPTTERPLPSSLLHSPPLTAPVQISSPPPSNKTPVPMPVALAPVAPSSMDIPGTLPPIAHQSTAYHKAPLPAPITPVASPPKGTGQVPEAVSPTRTRITPSISPVQGGPPMRGFPENPPAISPVVPGESPPHVRDEPPTSGFLENSPAISPIVPRESQPSIPVQGAPLPSISPKNPPATSPSVPDGDVSPASTPPTSNERKRNGIPVAAPPNETPEPIPPVSHSPTRGSFSAVPPYMHTATRHSTIAPSPSNSSPKSSSVDGYPSPASPPSTSDQHPRNKTTSPAPASYLVSPPSQHQDQVIPPAASPKGGSKSNAPPPSPSAEPPTNRTTPYAPPPILPAVPPTSRPSQYAPPPFLPALSPKGTPRHFAPPPFPPTPPTDRTTPYAPPPFLPAVPPTGKPSHYPPPPFPSALPPTGRSAHDASPPFLPTVSQKGMARHFAPPPFPPTVPPTNRAPLYAPPPFLPVVLPTSRPLHYAPPPSPPAVPPTDRTPPYAPPPFLPVVPPTGKPSHYAPPPFLPAESPKGMPRHFAPPPFPHVVPPTDRAAPYATPPYLPTVPPTGRPTHYAPPPLSSAVPPIGRPSRYAPPPFFPAVSPKGRPEQYAPSPFNPGSSNTISPFPFPPSMSQVSPVPSLAPNSVSGSTTTSFNPHLPRISPSESLSKSPEMSPPPPIMALPPPPPSEDCSGTICTEPLTNTPPGSPCACVWPMQVGLSLSVDLYTFFPLVSELAAEIAAGVFMKQSQVRIMGANAASQQPGKTVVLVDLVPLGEKFDNTTAFLTFERFWSKKVDIKESDFGDYEVLYVRYQGLPPSPPLPPSSIGMIDDGPYSGNDNNGRTIKPIGVDVGMKTRRNGLSGSIIAIIALSAFVVVVLCSAGLWVLLLRHRGRASQQPPTPLASVPSLAQPSGNIGQRPKISGTAGSMIGSVPSSASLSFASSIATYTGSAKTYSITDIERATNNFDESRILGEGGFGRVYNANLDDGTKAAVKVLKRDDQQGGREFLAEVEMLSRLNHRNLVKLIGICTDERARCLVYELIPNGSVESHLHGVDKESAPLDWVARMKIALGAARGLAYLHEDSSPRVIHRDFKSSNILLEHDFTPKVSDFGLARTALDEENRHISTRVMGTFGYVAPEYAMTGHLLVKSDVYSYGVVLLELLTGRKPVDMSQPPGQENLVAWARPLLTSNEGLEILIDSSLRSDVPFDSVSKVAAIASMCVQPEVSHRPFMGEVVQALKLVCNECDEARDVGSRTSSHGNLSADVDVDLDGEVGSGSGSGGSGRLPDPERGLSVSELFGAPAGAGGQASGSFRRHSSSGPLRTGRGWQFWQRVRGVTGGSAGEHGNVFRLRPDSY